MPIEGLRLIGDFISRAEEAALVERIDGGQWDRTFRRRTQQYGARYEYGLGKRPRAASVSPMPTWIEPVIERVIETKIFDRAPAQMLVNEYLPGQGISAHIDAPTFGPVVTALSLGAPMPIEFLEEDGPVSVWLPPRSLLVFSGRARSGVRHRIAPRRSDPSSDGARILRGRRLSITFRTVLGA